VKRPYDRRFAPAAPVLRVRAFRPSALASVDFDAKVDTGADLCAIPAQVVEALDLSAERSVRATGFGGPPQEVPVYRIDVELAGFRLSRLEAVATARSWALLGRNALRHIDVRLDGPREQLTVRNRSRG